MKKTYSPFWFVVCTQFLILLICLFPPIMAAETQNLLKVGNFSSETSGTTIPSGWEAYFFKKIARHTDYRIVEQDDNTVLRAESRASASGIIKKVSIDPKKFPVVEWRWKVSNILEKGDITKKDGDDCAARLYINFEYDPSGQSFIKRARYAATKILYGEYPPGESICYIWGSRASEEKVIPNAYTDTVMMFAVQSAVSDTNEWVTERRDILEDYSRSFKGTAHAISSIAIMSDSDNTGESVTAWYGDIIFSSGPSPEQ